MPLFKIKNKSNLYQLAIWKIEEPLRFFQHQVSIPNKIKLEKKQLEFLTSRYLLKLLDPDFPFSEVFLTANGKPVLSQNNQYFSISHSFPFVGVAIAASPIGIDVQTYQDKILRLQSKFISAEEQIHFKNDIRLITLAWAAKEAVFKSQGLEGIDFKAHMPVVRFTQASQQSIIEINFRKTQPEKKITTEGNTEEDFGWMVTLPQK